MMTQAKPTGQMQLILDEYLKTGPLPIEDLTFEIARLIPLPDRAAVAVYGHHFAKKALVPFPLPVGNIEHRILPGAEGAEILARIYTPKGDRPKNGWPILLYFHGGGFVLANLDTYDSSCRALCDGASALVVSVHYRQAPEYPWPAAPEDAFTSYQWVLANAGEINGDANRIAVGGESAGGNLAAVVSQMARDKTTALPVHQLLVYPVTDMVNGPASESALENSDAKPLNQAMLSWFYDYYIPEAGNRAHPYASPIYATTLAGLPPATVILSQIDPLRSEGETYAAQLEAAGVPVTLKIYEGVTHEFFGMAGLVNESTEAVALAVKNLRLAFDR